MVENNRPTNKGLIVVNPTINFGEIDVIKKYKGEFLLKNEGIEDVTVNMYAESCGTIHYLLRLKDKVIKSGETLPFKFCIRNFEQKKRKILSESRENWDRY